MKILVVTDSNADIPPHLTEKYNIGVVPAILIVRGIEYRDGEGITREEYYAQIPELDPPPTTAAPAPGAFDALFRAALDQGAGQVIGIFTGGELSAIYNTAKTAALSFGEKVKVLDSQQISLGIGFQVLAAAEAAAQGKSMLEIEEEVREVRSRLHVAAMLDTLVQLRRSGRISWAKANIGEMIQAKPFVGVAGGKVIQMGAARTRRKGIQRLKEMLLELGPVERLGVLHTNSEQEARAFLDSLGSSAPKDALTINVSAVIGTHVGVNALGYAAVAEK
ncbi:MAG: DegV family protein [Anaerolineae bacterium]|nr:DegV family protein [Anaerolineae bacterium]